MERANFFVHFVGWGGEKRRLVPGGIPCLVADFWVDSGLCSLVSFCCLCRDLGVFLILLLWGFPRGFGEETPFRRLLEGVAGGKMERFGGIWRQGLLVFRDFGVFGEAGWRIIGRFWGGKRACVCVQTSLCFRWNAEAFGSELFGVWGEMHLRLRGNVLAFWGVWVLRGIREVVCWIWMAVWVGVFSSWWSLMDCFGLPFWGGCFVLLWAVVLELLFCLLLVWVFVWLCFFLVFDKRFCLWILSG